jgi:hypothetical protein
MREGQLWESSDVTANFLRPRRTARLGNAPLKVRNEFVVELTYVKIPAHDISVDIGKIFADFLRIGLQTSLTSWNALFESANMLSLYTNMFR